MLLAVECFGGLRIHVDGRKIGFAQRKSKALVAYLAVTGMPVPRAVLSTLLWSEIPDARARANLRVALTDVRTQLGPVLAADREEVWLSPSSPPDVDTKRFENAVGEGSWDAAIALYLGPFLDGFFVEKAPGFEEWTARTREQLHRTALGVLQGAAEERLDAGDTTGLVAVLSRQVALEPWHEEPRRRLMQALAGAGNPGAAVDEYRRLRRLLADELGTSPEPETLALAERIAGHGRAMVRDSSLGAVRLATVPAPSSPIVGREEEVRRITKALTDPHRLVSLTGPGGVGKTRLAQEVAGRLAVGEPTRVAFVDLSGLTTAGEIPTALAAAVGVPLIGLREPLAEIAAALSGPSTVLVLDNLEHLLPTGSTMVAALLTQCPPLRILATSRVRLGLDAEQVVRVRPLALPDTGTLDHELLSSPAVELFVRRAEATGAVISTEELGTVAELCRRLDGLPLAVELAAMHMRYFTAGEVLSTFGTTLGELDDGGVERPARHRTLLDSVGWSYRMLDGSAQRLLRYLGVFRGGVSLDVLSPALLPGVPQYRSAVVALLDAGLLDRQEVAGRSRLTMMSATQAFALRALDRERESADADARHCAVHLAFAERADRAIRGHDQLAWLRRLEEETDNMTAALRHAAVHDPLAFLRLANALSWFWNLRARFREGGRWLLEAIDRAQGIENAGPELAQALMNAALLYARRGRSPGGEALVDRLIERADIIVTRLGDDRGRAAVDHLRVLRQLFLGMIDPASVAKVVDDLRRGQATFDSHGDSWAAGRLGFTLATLLFFQQDLDGMLVEAEATRARFEALGDRRSVGSVLNVLGLAKMLLGDIGAGRQMLRQALHDLQAVGDHMETINSLHVSGYSFVALGDDVPAGARLLGAGARLCANSGLLYAATLQAEVDRVATIARDRIGGPAWQAAWRQGWDEGAGVTVPD